MKISPTAEPAKAKWTKMPKYAAGGDAMMVMCDNDLPYHNWNHLVAMYNYLADTKQPYNVELDYAIMFHDYIYDASPKKEFRSAVAFEKIALDVDEPLWLLRSMFSVKVTTLEFLQLFVLIYLVSPIHWQLFKILQAYLKKPRCCIMYHILITISR
jgi:hypothetical protein